MMFYGPGVLNENSAVLNEWQHDYMIRFLSYTGRDLPSNDSTSRKYHLLIPYLNYQTGSMESPYMDIMCVQIV